jgi:hypothetical protein
MMTCSKEEDSGGQKLCGILWANPFGTVALVLRMEPFGLHHPASIHFRKEAPMLDELEGVVHDVWRDSRLLSTAPAEKLAAMKDDLIEAREALNDAIDKAEKAKVAA